MFARLILIIGGCAGGVAQTPATPVAVPASETPCFAGKPALKAGDIYKQLEPYAWSLYLSAEEPQPPPTTYGTCKVARNVISAADGSLVGELGCGMRVVKRGILDDLGLQIGARGRDVLDRKPRPVQPLRCMANGPDQVRCSFDNEPDTDTNPTSYVIAGALPGCAAEAPCEPLTGAAAVELFAARELVELHVSFWCH